MNVEIIVVELGLTPSSVLEIFCFSKRFPADAQWSPVGFGWDVGSKSQHQTEKLGTSPRIFASCWTVTQSL